MKEIKQSVCIIGCGAAGMMAGIASARNGHKVTIFERNPKAGRKILVTGNGRCNVTNQNISWKNFHGEYPKFAISVISKFTNFETIALFEELGLAMTEEDSGRIFPSTNNAQSVVDVLKTELHHLGVEVIYNARIQRVKKTSTGFLVVSPPKKEFLFDKLIIATGGKSLPKLGSSGDGYRFAEDLGHKIIKIFPASTPFRISSKVCNSLQGIKVNAGIKILDENNKIVVKNSGELMFTHLGVSAPAILEISRKVSQIYFTPKNPTLTCSIDFFPDYNHDELAELIASRIEKFPERNLGNIFHELLPKKVTPVILEKFRIDPLIKSSQISKKLIEQLIQIFSDYRETIDSVLDWDTAQFTAGGVDTAEIDSKTMESKIVPGLFFAGEVVDIDGDSGGYNLQWAWSSGFVAGSN